MRRLLFLTAFALALLGPDASAQSLGLTVDGVGVSFGDARRITGVRFNYRDRRMERVDGVNVTLWSPYTPAKGTVNGIAVGVPLTGARRINGLTVALGAANADERIAGIMVAGIGFGASEDIVGVGVSGIGLGSGRDIKGLMIGGFGIGSGRNLSGVMAAAFGIGSGRRLTGVFVGGVGAGAGGDVKGIVVGGLGVGAGGAFTGIGIGGLDTRRQIEIIVEQATVPVVVDAGILWPNPSTVLRLTGDEIEVLREGQGEIPT